MYEAYITRIKNLRKHSNADRLQVGECFGNFVIVDLRTFENELGVYFPTDGKIGIEYATQNNLLRKKDENGNSCGGYLDPERRNITSLKLRGEKSDGLFMPLTSLDKFCDIEALKEGDKITVLNGIVICEKYIPVKKTANKVTSNKVKPKNVDRISFPLFEEHVDTSQLAYNLHQFKTGDTCYITLKMHGTSGRTSYSLEEFQKKQNLIQKLLKIKNKLVKSWKYISGTRKMVLQSYANGYYGDNNFRRKWHDFFVDKLQKGETVYYEIVGYTEGSRFIMPECSNKKTCDKEFIKQYGDITKFTYGCQEGENNVYVYRMTMTNEDGYVVEYPWELVKLRCEQMCINHVPQLDKFIYTTNEDLMQRVHTYYDGADSVGKTHIREGIVVRIDNKAKFSAFKHKNFNFKVLESIIKVDAIEPDMEEAQEVIEVEEK
jgi:hypothetical protein